MAVQEYGAAPCSLERPLGDGDGAGQGGRGRTRQEQRWVPSWPGLGAIHHSHVFSTHSAGRTLYSVGRSCESVSGLCSRTALHRASSNGHTETVLALVEAGADVHCKTNAGYVAGLPHELDARVRVVGSLAG